MSTHLAAVRSLTDPIGDLGGRWMLHPEVLGPCRAAGYRNGYVYYVVGRGGVLGDVDADVVTAAFGFFAPRLMRKMWEGGVGVEGARVTAARYGASCAAFGRTRAAGFNGLDRIVALAERVSTGVDPSTLSLFAGWRAEPLPDDIEGRAYFLMHVLRELRGSVHLVAVLASGLSPLEAVLATGGEENATRFGWSGPFAPVAANAKEQAEALTDTILTRLYSSVLSVDEVVELASLAEGLRQHFGKR